MRALKLAGHVFRDVIMRTLDECGESFEAIGPQGDEAGDSWTIFWREVIVRGHYDEGGDFVWSAANTETGVSIDGSADDDPNDVAYEIERLAVDPMRDVWIETINKCLAEDDWSGIHVSDDGLTVRAYDSTSKVTRLATCGQSHFGAWRIGLLWALGDAQWIPHAEMQPENEAGIRAATRRAYEWVKAVDAE